MGSRDFSREMDISPPPQAPKRNTGQRNVHEPMSPRQAMDIYLPETPARPVGRQIEPETPIRRPGHRAPSPARAPRHRVPQSQFSGAEFWHERNRLANSDWGTRRHAVFFGDDDVSGNEDDNTILGGHEEPPMRIGVSSNTNTGTIGRGIPSGPLVLSGYEETPMRLGVSSNTNTGTIGRGIPSGPLVLSGYEETPMRLGVSSTHSLREPNRGDISRRGGHRSGNADSSGANTGTIGTGIVSGPLNVGVVGEGCMFDVPDGCRPGGANANAMPPRRANNPSASTLPSVDPVTPARGNVAPKSTLFAGVKHKVSSIFSPSTERRALRSAAQISPTPIPRTTTQFDPRQTQGRFRTLLEGFRSPVTADTLKVTPGEAEELDVVMNMDGNNSTVVPETTGRGRNRGHRNRRARSSNQKNTYTVKITAQRRPSPGQDPVFDTEHGNPHWWDGPGILKTVTYETTSEEVCEEAIPENPPGNEGVEQTSEISDNIGNNEGNTGITIADPKQDKGKGKAVDHFEGNMSPRIASSMGSIPCSFSRGPLLSPQQQLMQECQDPYGWEAQYQAIHGYSHRRQDNKISEERTGRRKLRIPFLTPKRHTAPRSSRGGSTPKRTPLNGSLLASMLNARRVRSTTSVRQTHKLVKRRGGSQSPILGSSEHLHEDVPHEVFMEPPSSPFDVGGLLAGDKNCEPSRDEKLIGAPSPQSSMVTDSSSTDIGAFGVSSSSASIPERDRTVQFILDPFVDQPISSSAMTASSSRMRGQFTTQMSQTQQRPQTPLYQHYDSSIYPCGIISDSPRDMRSALPHSELSSNTGSSIISHKGWSIHSDNTFVDGVDEELNRLELNQE